MKKYTAYTDGSCIPNPGTGGYGVVLKKPCGGVEEFYDGFLETTNNRMEAIAVLQALLMTPEKCILNIYTDSQITYYNFTNGRAVKNKEIFDMISEEAKKRMVRMQWVRGHNGDELNELADRLANKGREIAEIKDPGYNLVKK